MAKEIKSINGQPLMDEVARLQIEEINSALDTKVDKEEGKSLISDTEIERLSNVDNYDDTEVRESINELEESKADKSYVEEKIGDIDFSDYVTNEDFEELELIETSDTEPTDEDVVIWINTSQDDNLADVLARINDNTIASNTTWSSEKIENMINGTGGYGLWVGTQSEYEAIATKDENTIYMIKE